MSALLHLFRSEIHEKMRCTRCQTYDGPQSTDEKYAAQLMKIDSESDEETSDIGGFAEIAGCLEKLKRSEKQVACLYLLDKCLCILKFEIYRASYLGCRSLGLTLDSCLTYLSLLPLDSRGYKEHIILVLTHAFRFSGRDTSGRRFRQLGPSFFPNFCTRYYPSGVSW